MQNGTDVVNTGGGGLPTLSNGEAAPAHGLVVHTTTTPHGLWLNLVLALVVALAAPLILKWILESRFFSRLLRPSKASSKGTAAPAEEDFDFDQ